MPRVAAYFAAAEASARAKASSSSVESPLGSDIAVWVLDLQEFNDVRSDPHGEERWSEFPFWFITAPGHANRNLAAQQGCFTLYSPTVQVTETDRPLDIRPLDEVYARIEKLTLAVSEAPALLWLLDREGVTAASIFPGYAGVSQALRDEQLHEPIAALEETAH